jgi:hypothetical protein
MMRAGKIKSRAADDRNDSNGNGVYVRRGGGRLAMPDDRSRDRRVLAAQCLTAAHQSVDAALRAALLGMAQRWLDLANDEYDPAAPDALQAAITAQIIQVKLGQKLRAQFDLPRDLPQSMIALLTQL